MGTLIIITLIIFVVYKCVKGKNRKKKQINDLRDRKGKPIDFDLVYFVDSFRDWYKMRPMFPEWREMLHGTIIKFILTLPEQRAKEIFTGDRDNISYLGHDLDDRNWTNQLYNEWQRGLKKGTYILDFLGSILKHNRTTTFFKKRRFREYFSERASTLMVLTYLFRHYYPKVVKYIIPKILLEQLNTVKQ